MPAERSRNAQEARGDKDLVLRMKQQRMEDPASLTSNVSFPAEVRCNSCMLPCRAGLTSVFGSYVSQMCEMCTYLKSTSERVPLQRVCRSQV